MNAVIKIETYKSGKCLSIYVDDKPDVNELVITLIEAGFIVNYEPRENNICILTQSAFYYKIQGDCMFVL